MQGKLSLKGRLTACFLAFSMLPILLFFLLFFPYLRGSMNKSALTALEGLAAANVMDLEQTGEAILREGERLAMDPRMQAALAGGDEKALEEAQGHLQAMVGETCRGAALLWEDWEVAAASDPQAYTREALALLLDTGEGFGSAPGQVSGLLPSLGAPGRFSVYFTVPLPGKGALLWEMPLGVLDKKTQTPVRGETGRMMLVDQSGTILSHTEAGRAGQTLEEEGLLLTLSRQGEGAPGGYGSALMEGAQQAYGYRLLSNMPWMLVVYQAKSEVNAQEALVILFAVVATLGLSLLSFLIGRVVARSLVFPLRRLNAAFHQAGKNHFAPLSPGGRRRWRSWPGATTG